MGVPEKAVLLLFGAVLCRFFFVVLVCLYLCFLCTVRFFFCVRCVFFISQIVEGTRALCFVIVVGTVVILFSN